MPRSTGSSVSSTQTHPTKLDPEDPGQASLVEAWLEIRDTVVNEWTDKVFLEHFPDGRQARPERPRR